MSTKAVEIAVGVVHAATMIVHQPQSTQLAAWVAVNQLNNPTTSVQVPKK